MTKDAHGKITLPLDCILLVEDHHIAAQVGHDILRNFSHRVDIAYTGLDAVNLCRQQHYDFIFMDIGLPDTDGCQVTRKIREFEKNNELSPVPIVALTAHADMKERQACMDSGMQDVLTKPITTQKAEMVLETFLHVDKPLPDQTSEDTSITGDVIDMDMGIKLAGGNRELAEQAMSMLIKNLPTDAKQLEASYHYKNWLAMEATVRKLRGGACYCGTPRLEQACRNLYDCLSQKQYRNLDLHFHSLLSEINSLLEVWQPAA